MDTQFDDMVAAVQVFEIKLDITRPVDIMAKHLHIVETSETPHPRVLQELARVYIRYYREGIPDDLVRLFKQIERIPLSHRGKCAPIGQMLHTHAQHKTKLSDFLIIVNTLRRLCIYQRTSIDMEEYYKMTKPLNPAMRCTVLDYLQSFGYHDEHTLSIMIRELDKEEISLLIDI
jgi:hypothetical protein